MNHLKEAQRAHLRQVVHMVCKKSEQIKILVFSSLASSVHTDRSLHAGGQPRRWFSLGVSGH